MQSCKLSQTALTSATRFFIQTRILVQTLNLEYILIFGVVVFPYCSKWTAKDIYD